MKHSNITANHIESSPSRATNQNEVEEPLSYVDLKAYFKRIGYTGSTTPTLQTLNSIHALHPGAIPFENLNPFLGIPVQLDLTSLQNKLVFGGRGGYCFEHNLLLNHVLRAVGFKTSGLAARVIWNASPGAVAARGHMLLLVEVGTENYIADVGFGGLTLTAPLLLKEGLEQATSHEPFRILPAGGEFILQAKVKKEWKTLYQFSLQENLQPDYEVTSWYLSNHPDSHFVNSLIAARVINDKRYTLRNNLFVVHTLNKNSDKRAVHTVAELRKIMEEIFTIHIPNAPEADKKFQAIVNGDR